MANMAHEGDMDVVIYDAPPPGIFRLLQDDLIGVARPRACMI